ncbi:hypothetical protein HanIR_Chr13g0635831 [Helianthus annuus]|nr:hypothetical protein HanIR_Chr13g0635831 [Helianthus annuus]
MTHFRFTLFGLIDRDSRKQARMALETHFSNKLLFEFMFGCLKLCITLSNLIKRVGF